MPYPYINSSLTTKQETNKDIEIKTLYVKKWESNSTNPKNKVFKVYEITDPFNELKQIYSNWKSNFDSFGLTETPALDFIEIEQKQLVPSTALMSIQKDLFGKPTKRIQIKKSNTPTGSDYRFRITFDNNATILTKSYKISLEGLLFTEPEINNVVLTPTDSITKISEKVSQYLTDNNIEHDLDPFAPYIDIKTYNLNKLELKFINVFGETVDILTPEELLELNTVKTTITTYPDTTLTLSSTSFTQDLVFTSPAGQIQSEFKTAFELFLTQNNIQYTVSFYDYTFTTDDIASEINITPSDPFKIDVDDLDINPVYKNVSVIFSYTDVYGGYSIKTLTVNLVKQTDNQTDDQTLQQILTPTFIQKIGNGVILNGVLTITSTYGFNNTPLTSNNQDILIDGFKDGVRDGFSYNEYIPSGVYENIVFDSNLYNNILEPTNDSDKLIRANVFKEINEYIKSKQDTTPIQDFIGFVNYGNFKGAVEDLDRELDRFKFDNKSFVALVSFNNLGNVSNYWNLGIETALIRVARLSTGSYIKNIMQPSAGEDNFTGGYHLINVPYHNTFSNGFYKFDSTLISNSTDNYLRQGDRNLTSVTFDENNNVVFLNVFTTSLEEKYKKLEVRDLEIYWRKFSERLIRNKLAQNKIASKGIPSKGTYSLEQVKAYVIGLYQTLYNIGIVDNPNLFASTLNISYDAKTGTLYLKNYMITTINGIDFVSNSGILI